VVHDRSGPVSAQEYYLVLKESTTRVQYGGSANIFNYDAYAGGRKATAAKPDVPLEISRYFTARGKPVITGPISEIPTGDTVIVTYDELWGWDVGDILKRLEIRMFKNPNSGDTLRASFEEMTIFNSRPSAKSLVPKMLDSLLVKK
jgi:hypothetical protein